MANINFPVQILRKNCTVIDFFCAGFEGVNTWHKVRDKAGKYVGVDTNNENLMSMADKMDQKRDRFYNRDVYQYAKETSEAFDIVILDPWTRDFKKVYDNLGMFSQLAVKHLLVSTNAGHVALLPPQSGGLTLAYLWKRNDYLNGTYWAVYERYGQG